MAGFFNNVEFLIEPHEIKTRDEWYSYNVEKKVISKIADLNNYFYLGTVYKYTESLIAVEGSKLVKWSEFEDDDEFLIELESGECLLYACFQLYDPN